MSTYINKMIDSSMNVMSGDVFNGCTLAQDKANTILFDDIEDLKFIGLCNLQNVVIRDSWEVGCDCFTPAHKDVEDMIEPEADSVDADINDTLYSLKYHAYMNNDKTTSAIRDVYTDEELDGVELKFKEAL